VRSGAIAAEGGKENDGTLRQGLQPYQEVRRCELGKVGDVEMAAVILKLLLHFLNLSTIVGADAADDKHVLGSRQQLQGRV
jgi:hypothetical protein